MRRGYLSNLDMITLLTITTWNFRGRFNFQNKNSNLNSSDETNVKGSSEAWNNCHVCLSKYWKFSLFPFPSLSDHCQTRGKRKTENGKWYSRLISCCGCLFGCGLGRNTVESEDFWWVACLYLPTTPRSCFAGARIPQPGWVPLHPCIAVKLGKKLSI